MRRNPYKFSLAILAVSLLAFSGFQGSAKDELLPNFHQVNATLYRSGRPKKGAMQEVKKMGIKTILNLRANDGKTKEEENEAATEGLRFFNVPMDTFDRPTDAQIEKVLSIINDTANQPVLVHCTRGKDRTGTVIACYRIKYDKWTDKQALKEAKQYGIGWWQIQMKDYIKDFYRKNK
jgi:protein tyrosine/serine phosphatase